jgi:hypothetical protein
MVMLTKVIYRDGKVGEVVSSTIEELRHEGKIAAYQVFHRWVEVRREQQSNPNYKGSETRKHPIQTTSL